jgi:hypothetical protein
MTNAERQKRYRLRKKREAKQTRGIEPPHFRAYADFVPVFNAARRAAIEVYGEGWSINPEAYVWARLPVAWVRCKVATGKRSFRFSATSRDHKLPVAKFWPRNRLPIGPEYAPPIRLEDPSVPLATPRWRPSDLCRVAVDAPKPAHHTRRPGRTPRHRSPRPPTDDRRKGELYSSAGLLQSIARCGSTVDAVPLIVTPL